MKQQELIPHLFRTEFRKITAVLCKVFGMEHIEIAEDLASETFLSALETWTYKGIPENPTAWLYAVAKNKAKNYIARNNIFKEKITRDLKHSQQENAEIEIDLSDKNITDSQLQMLFAICNPTISTEAQIGLALRILCGFGIDEIGPDGNNGFNYVAGNGIPSQTNFYNGISDSAVPEPGTVALIVGHQVLALFQ